MGSGPAGHGGLWRWVKLAIAVACLAWVGWVVHGLGPRRIWDEVRRADPAWFALSLGAIGARFAIWAGKWNLMLGRQGSIGYGATIHALMAGVFVNLTTPTAKLAGGFVRAALVRTRLGCSGAEAYGWSLADQVTNVLGNLAFYGLLATAGAAFVLDGDSGRPLFVSGIVALVLVLTVVALRPVGWRAFSHPRMARWLGRFTPVRFRTESGAGWVTPVFEPLMLRGATWRVAPLDLGLAGASFAALCAANALVLRALGADAPIALISVAVVVGYFAGTLFGTVGGAGVTEVALIKLFGMAGVSPEISAAGALLHRASYYGVTLLWGGPLLALGLRRLKREARATG